MLCNLSREEARNEVLQHYVDVRGNPRELAETFIPKDDRIFELWEAVQQEIEMSKRIGKRIAFQSGALKVYEIYLLDEYKSTY